jgi:hypothetical protein
MSFGPRFSICLPIFKEELSDHGTSSGPTRFASFLCFTLIGMSLSLLWSSISFQASTYDRLFGKQTWAILIVAYNAPGLFALIVQLLTDPCSQARASQRDKSNLLWSLRIAFSLAAPAALCISFPWVLRSGSRGGLIGFAIATGITIGFAHGWLYSFASLFPGAKPTAYLLVGQGLATLFLAGLQLGIGLKPSTSVFDVRYLEYFLPAGSVIVLGLVVTLLFSCSSASRSAISGGSAPESSSLMAEEHSQLLVASVNDGNERIAPLTRRQVAKAIAFPMLAIFFSTWLQIGMVSLVVHVPNETPKSFDMPSVLLWSSSLASLAGTELQSVFGHRLFKRGPVLFVASLLHFVMLPFIVVYSLVQFWVNNAFTIAYMIVMLMTNGYLISDAYRMSGTLVSGKEDRQVAQVLMNIALYLAVYIGMTTPFWLNPLSKIL